MQCVLRYEMHDGDKCSPPVSVRVCVAGVRLMRDAVDESLFAAVRVEWGFVLRA